MYLLPDKLIYDEIKSLFAQSNRDFNFIVILKLLGILYSKKLVLLIFSPYSLTSTLLSATILYILILYSTSYFLFSLFIPPARIIYIMFFSALRSFLSRYITVWRNVWAVRHQLEVPKRTADELAFLPAHLELTDTPVSAAPKWTARFIMIFTLLALLWSWFGKIDIVAAASGKTISGGRSKTIQPLETAVVKAVYVHDGQHVKQSHTLPHIDTISAHSLGLIDTDIQAAQLLAQNQYQAWATQDAQLQSVLRGHQAELQSAKAQEQKLIAVGTIEQQKTTDYKQLKADNFISEHAFLEQQSKSISNQNDLKSTRSQIQQIQAAILQAEQNQILNTQNLKRDTLDALRQANEQIDQYHGQTDKAKQRQQLMTIQSPVNGTVQELSIYTIGGVVQAAQKMMVIAPDDNHMDIEVLVLNKDIGFVEPNQDAVIKIESFPYTRYGYLTGKVKSISHDAVSHEQLGLVYTAVISLDKYTLNVDGKRINLTAGMNVTAEIKTGKRRVLDYLLSPLQTKLDESFKER